MDFRYLKAFIATAENGSFSKAAEKLNIAQSAVSRQIRLLEDSIDQELILRSSKQLVLTPKGQEVLSLSRSFLNDIDHSLSDSMRFAAASATKAAIAVIKCVPFIRERPSFALRP